MRFRRQDRRLSELQETYNAADAKGDYHAGMAALETITREFPDVSWGWYDLGLRHKWLRNWALSRDCNLRAMELVQARAKPPSGEFAEAWNLGIAATALGDWALARRAWRAFGVEIDGEGNEPIVMDFGLTPIRLNPEPRFAEPELLVDGARYETEVAWATRLCPTRARIESVPLPGSGHRNGDVVLHDGDPVGERRYGDGVRSVFNEIMLLERGPYATLTTELPAPPAPEDVNALEELFHASGYAASCWSTNVQVLCKACSEGTVDSHHDHAPDVEPEQSLTSLNVGIAAPPAEADRLLDAWAAAGQGRLRGSIESA